MTSPVHQAQQIGQSIWYDMISRELLDSGELARLVEEEGVRGVTSNPAIFEKAIGGSADYDEQLRALVEQTGQEAQGEPVRLFEALAIADIQHGCDVLRPVYDETRGGDGYVSLEVSPHLADDTTGTIEEARRLWAAVGRDNLMIKVPATPAGVPAIATLIGEGIHVNVTLLFAVEAYAAVCNAYLEGLEQRVARGEDVSRVASVASFFVSRVDAAVDARLAARLESEGDESVRAQLRGLEAKAAIANAVMAYAHFDEVIAGERWQALAARGAMPQRVLWASTGTKSPSLPKTLYVDALIGPHTVNTTPVATFDAFRREGTASDALGADKAASIEAARDTLARLEALGISLKEVTDELLPRGCQLFCDAFDTLLGAVAQKRAAFLGPRLASLDATLGSSTESVERALDALRTDGAIRRLWARDASLWTGGEEDRWLGWLCAPGDAAAQAAQYAALATRVHSEGTRHVVVMGMGGSSLCPDVLSRTFGPAPGHPEVLVLDSTVPAQVASLEARLELDRTLFVVPSKSGGTIEPNCFMAYFWDRVETIVGKGEAAKRFIAITDPGTALDRHANALSFSATYHGVPSIGGRFSALSAFGLVPGACLGLDIEDFLARTRLMADACSASAPPAHNPGVRLGAILGTLARQGRDKLSLITSPGIATLGAWLEQLVAESTGKLDRGIVPIDGEALGAPGVYGDDRLFVYTRLASAPDAGQDAAIEALEAAGQPVVRIELGDARDLGQEFFRWQIATAVAGALLEIDPFDQPDVEAAKVAARELMAAYERDGALPSQTPLCEDADFALYADERNARALPGDDVETKLAAHLARIGRGDYFALHAYLESKASHDALLQAMRMRVRERSGAATTLGYGPRFLHSTGQLHKGGPNRGVFLQLTADDPVDLPVPGAPYRFGVLAAAQAQGDFDVLAQRERRVVRLHIRGDVTAGLEKLAALFETESPR